MGASVGLSRVILVIESDHETRVSARRFLEDAGYFVISVANGADALSTLLKISTPDMVILGSDLSIMTSEQFLNILKNSPEYETIPLAQIRKPGDATLDDICHFIASPLRRDELLKLVEVCLKKP